ncbi:hypothetical protein IKG13_00775 [Candidatus Saccharibacteria bacterium]|nr:hypothetical protein [Candidatus Saccharibacteria bacterium]MBR3377910.1 hypothetical protein [Candidatus Saccharibacteria bacterium]
MNWSIIAMCFCAFILAYYTSGMIVTILMERYIYQFSIDIMTNYIRREVDYNDGDLDEEIESRATALNMQIRIVITLFSYAILALLLMLMATDTHDRGLITVGFVATLGLMINLLFALILEYQCRASVLYYKGIDNQSKIHFIEVFADSDEVDMTLDVDDGVNAEGLFEPDDIIVMLIPPVGDIVYNPLI